MNWKDSAKLINLFPQMMIGTIPLVGNICPDCGKGNVHLYIHVWDGDCERASFWIWCDHCDSFAHGTAKAPEIFKNFSFLDSDELDIPPDYINLHSKEIDEQNKRIEVQK